MNSERFTQNDLQQAPFSPKKKLHVKDKCSLADTVTSARESLKNAKDISARNLLAACSARTLIPSSTSSSSLGTSDEEEDSDSSLDDIVAIEEENTDYVSEKDLFDSDDEEEIIEEVVEEYYEEVVPDDDDDSYDTEDSELEPLPPPIEIPDSLKVKDNNDEESFNNSGEDDEGDDSGYDDPQEDLPEFRDNNVRAKPAVASVVTKAASERQHERPKHESLRPSVLRGFSICSPTRASNSPYVATSPSKTEFFGSQPTTPTMIAAAIQADSFKSNENKLRPGAVRGFSFEGEFPSKGRGGRKSSETEEAESLPKTPPPSESSNGVVWEKPEWTKNNMLRATGKAPSGNLARPITNLPQAPKSPKATPMTTYTPKTAPQAPRKTYTAATPPPVNARSHDDDHIPNKIGWEKPEWTKRKVLRQTSKSETVFSGGNIERPIGGIRPIEEN